jgi:hypothetical protein
MEYENLVKKEEDERKLKSKRCITSSTTSEDDIENDPTYIFVEEEDYDGEELLLSQPDF